MYSIDKIKIIIHGIKITVIQLLLDKLSAVIDKDLVYYQSKSVTKCYYNFMYNGVYLGIDNNWNKGYSKAYKNIVLEWNPNKRKLDSFPVNLALIFEDLRKIEVMSLDIAVDINIALENLIVLKAHELQRIGILGHNRVETIYLSSFNDNNFCRIYDKAKEQKMKDVNLTRIEMHLKNIGFWGYYKFNIKPPTVLMIDNELDDISDTNRVLIYACYQLPHLLTMLETRKRKQIKDLIKSKLKPIEIDIEKIEKIINEFKFLEDLI